MSMFMSKIIEVTCVGTREELHFSFEGAESVLANKERDA